MTMEVAALLDPSAEIFDFLNTTQTGAAHSSIGISLESFLSSLIFSLIYCCLQTILFSYLRPKFKEFYQPLSYCVPDFQKVEPLNNDLFAWVKPILKTPIGSYYKLGLDSYYFLKFMYILLFLFTGMAVINIPVLIIINLSGGDETTKDHVHGLDLISTSNISTKHTSRYMFHFILTIFVVLWFHYMLIHQLKACVKEKQNNIIQNYKIKSKRARMSTILIQNIPAHITDTNELKLLFDLVPGGVRQIIPVVNFHSLNNTVNKFKKHKTILEELELQVIESKIISLTTSKSASPKETINQVYKPLQLTKEIEVTIPGICEIVDAYTFTTQRLKSIAEEINYIRETQLTKELYSIHHGKAFVMFNKIYGAYFAHQLLLTKTPGEMSPTIIEMDPEDLIWENIIIPNQKCSATVKSSIIFFISIVIIVCWVVPIAFVGSISQLPYLTTLIPTIRWLNGLPDFIKGFIAGILPTIVLTFLTGVALSIFRFLTYRKGKLTGAQVELSLQNWIFVFLFFHLFIVITISSGFIVVLESFLYNPSSIPAMVAQDFPKASNFFYSFFVLKGLTLFGNSLLQFQRLITDTVLSKIYDKTPRQKFQRKMAIPSNSWGMTYPTFSVYGSIGIVYSVISPLILVFCCINFLLDLLSYKYCLKYVYKMKNSSETYGRIYSIAIRQLYAGIYSLEIFLIGLFFIVEDNNGEQTCIMLGILMVIALIITIWCHLVINKKFDKSMIVMPLQLCKQLDEVDNNDNDPQGLFRDEGFEEHQLFEEKLKFLHPSFNFKPEDQYIWIPKDPFGISDHEKSKLEKMGLHAFNEGCLINESNQIELLFSPPDYTFK